MIWLTRLQGADSGAIPLWSENPQFEMYAAFWAGTTEEQLDQPLRYRNQSGAPFETSLRDILTHVALDSKVIKILRKRVN